MFHYNYYQDDNFIFTVFYGGVTSQEIHEVIDEIQKIEQNEGTMIGLTIFCNNVKAKGINAKDIMNAGERMKNVSFRKNGKNAIIAKTLLAYGLSRMFQVATEILHLDELKVYKEKGFDEAVEWLGLEHLRGEIENIINEHEENNVKL